MGILDQDVSDKVSLAVPQLYRKGMERKEWTSLKFWLYMADGIFQSAICFFMGYLLFAPATFETESGRGIADQRRMGVYIACIDILVVNSYILLNTYRWDWLMVLITTLSVLLIFFWTGVYSSFKGSFQFYKAGQEVYGQLTFWALLLLTLVICLLPRFSVKFFQKNYRPYDVDIIREQVRQGKFDYLEQYEAFVPPKAGEVSGSSSETAEEMPSESGKPRKNSKHGRHTSTTESQRPIYPPSEATTAATRHPHSQQGSDGTDKTGLSLDVSRMPRRPSLDKPSPSFEQVRGSPARPSPDRARPSYERSRSRQSFDKLRPSFEISRDFTSAAYLSRVESTGLTPTSTRTPVLAKRREDISDELRG